MELRALHAATAARAEQLPLLIDRMRELAAQVDAPIAVPIIAHCEARLAQDPAATERAVRELARCGQWLPTPGVLGVLSNREREIASMAALGYSSKVIANRLVVSPRTVETHLSRVFAKLGVTNRDDLPGALGLDRTLGNKA